MLFWAKLYIQIVSNSNDIDINNNYNDNNSNDDNNNDDNNNYDKINNINNNTYTNEDINNTYNYDISSNDDNSAKNKPLSTFFNLPFVCQVISSPSNKIAPLAKPQSKYRRHFMVRRGEWWAGVRATNDPLVISAKQVDTNNHFFTSAYFWCRYTL